jgi:N-acetylmuramoyl-L-alanine amidase
MRKIEFITLHTAGAADKLRAVHQSGKQIRDYHVNVKGWKEIGYHAYVEENGSVSQYARPELNEPAAVEGWNKFILALCCSGHGDLEAWNPHQVAAVVRWCADKCRRYNLTSSRVIGHHEADEHGAPKVFKTCPGKLVDLAAIRAEVARALGERPVDALAALLRSLDERSTPMQPGELHDLANDIRRALAA